uniref:LPXTG cell wall anchor domain-containing protein n=1 Tax=Methanobrevibacter smithii TaxID=2173 RepID=UPI0037DCA0FA
MIKSKNVVKKLTTILFTLVAVFATGLTNVNAETTAEVNKYSDLVEKMNDKTTNVVKLTSDITLREDLDTTFSLEMSKTLDFNGFTLTIPQQYKLKLIYYNTLDLKFINSSSSKTAKLKILANYQDPIYNEIQKAEYTVNFEIDGVDVEYERDFETFWSYAGRNGFNNLVFKNLKITGFYSVTYGANTMKFSNVTKESKNSPEHTVLINSSTLTVDDIIDADSVIEYYPSSGTKVTANRTATLDTIDCYWGPITVKKKEVQTIMANNEATLRDAVNQINNSKDTVIKLSDDIKLTNFLEFYVLGNVTLDLAGNTLDVTKGSLIFYYGYKDENNYNFRSNLTIKDSGNGNNGKIIGKGFDGRVRISTIDMAEELKNLPKAYGFTIDGGTYAVTGTDSWDEYIFDVFSDSEPNKQNITLNVNVKKGIFEVGKVDGGIFHFPDTNMTANFNFETLMVKGQGVILGFNILGKKRINEVIPTDTKVYYTYGNQVIELEDKATLVMHVKTGTSASQPQYIKLAKETGLSVDNVTLPNVIFGYTDGPEAIINIANIGAAELKITNVTVSDTDKFEIIGTTQPTIGIGATNTDFKIKAKSGLSAGTYTPTITVTDENGKTYTATVTLKVEPKQLTGLGINLASTWVYKETKTPTLIGVEGLTPDDYAITYSKKDDSENYGKIMPILVGKYKATLSITNPNYTASEASVDFEITQITTEVKVKSYDETFTYNGSEHTKNAYDVLWANNASAVTDNKLPNGDKVTAEITGKVRDVKDTADGNNTIESITITNAEGVDVTNCYSNIVKAAGKLTVNPISTPIVVTAGSDTKEYDGTELTKNTYTYTDGVLLSGDMLEATITGSQKFVGSSNNVVSNVKVVRNGEDITSNYTIGTHVNGVLEVTSADQPLAIADQYVRVNGSISKGYLEQTVTGNVGNISFSIKSGTALTYNATNEEYEAGATEGDVVMTVTAVKVDLGGDGTPEWKETSKDFTVHVVNKTDVNISGLSNNETFTYDGNPKKPTGTISVNAGTVNVSDLEVLYKGTGSTSYSSATAPTNAGTYTVTYKVPDTNANYTGTFSVAFTIKKAQLEKVTLVKDTFEYTGSDITPTLNNVNSNIEVTGDTKAKNVSNNTITAKIKDKVNYEWKDGSNGDLTINWSITQATPDYTVPTGLTGVKGETLNDVTLPGRFTWNDTTVVLTAGTHTYKATYTPEDTTNYKTITDIDIEVVVKNTFDVITSVPGGNGTITPSILDVVEGTKVEITFTPNTGYMIDKVLVNTVETTVIGNKIELTVDEEKDVAVSYKKIPFTVTVKDVDGATITPNGVVAVSYGETQEFTITANSGYKLVKVLVDGTDKTADMVGDTLKLTNITSNINLEVVVEKIVYEVTEGANQKYTITKNNEAKFKINADFRLFDDGKVYVDNELVDPKNYTAESGSTIITLKKEFVDTLSVGEHTLKVLFNDGGEAITTFNVARVTVPTDNPQTGDNIGFYIISGILSIVGLAGAGIFYRRKQTN